MNQPIKLFNTFFPQEWLEDLRHDIKEGKYGGFQYGWKANKTKGYDQGHWNIPIAKQENKLRRVDISRTPEFQGKDVISAMWDEIKREIGDRKLIRAYINGYTYGTDGYAHRDEYETWALAKEHLGPTETVLVYLNPQWDMDWAGETVFYGEDGEIHYSVLPRYGRTVVFDSTMLHAARPVSRACPENRMVLVFKTAAPTEDGLESKWEYVFARTAHVNHSGGNFFSHLKSTYELLEKDGEEQYLCDAGLYHSVYGTCYFDPGQSASTNRETIVRHIGERAENLVWIFCNTEDRMNAILDNSGAWSKDVWIDLLKLERANILEQAGRNGKDYSQFLNKINQLINENS